MAYMMHKKLGLCTVSNKMKHCELDIIAMMINTHKFRSLLAQKFSSAFNR